MMPASVMSDEDRIWMKRLVAKHKPDGIDYDIKPIFGIVEDTLTHCSILSFEDAIMDSLPPVEDRRHHPGYTKLLEAFSTKIELISSEISCKTLGGVDEHSTTVAIFDVLTMYNWDVKIVLALAAFTVTYGEFWLLVHVHGTYQLAQTLGILKQLPSIMEHASSLKPRFDTLNHLVNITLEVTKCIIGFHGLPTQYTTAYNYIPIACYWILRSIVACTAQIRSLTTLGILTSTDTWDLSSLSFRLINIIDHLSQELDSWRECIDKQPEMMSTGSASKMDDEAYAKLGDLLKKPHSDNMEVLKALIYEHDDILPLYDGLSKKRDSLEVLRRKNVMLIISGLELTPVEIRFLNLAYKLFKGGPRRAPGTYEWVWIPIVDLDSDWTEQKQKMFESVKERMNWYSVYDHSWIGKPVITFIQREWKYKNRPIIVVLDPQGEVTCLNALYMLTIWGSLAYPFTSSREEALWKEETLKLNLLISGLEFTDWSLRGKYIFLYGGDDPDWIRRFVEEARRVATAANIPLEMVYLGKGNRAEKVEKIRSIITTEKLPTHYWSLYKIWLFWFRIQNMLFSKLQLKQIHNDYDNDDNKIHEIKMLLCNDDDDKVMHEIKKLLSFDKQGGWFILSHVNRIEVTGNATTGLQTLVEYDTLWKEHVDRDGFAKAFKDHYDKILPIVSSCCKFQFSPKIERIQEALTCPECRNNMHVLTTFQCCHGEKTADDEFFFSTVTPPTN